MSRNEQNEGREILSRINHHLSIHALIKRVKSISNIEDRIADVLQRPPIGEMWFKRINI